MSGVSIEPGYQEFERFFHLSLDMMSVCGFDGFFKLLNPAWEDVLGYSLEELLAKPYLDFVHPDDKPKTIAEALKVEAGAKTLFFENRYRCKNGKYKWLSWTATPVADRGVLFAIARDITQIKHKANLVTTGDAISRILAEPDRPEVAFARILETVGSLLGWEAGAAWLLSDEDGGGLRCAETWHDSANSIDDFLRLTRHSRFELGIGLPGRVWESAESIWVEDVTQASFFLRAAAAEKEGLHAAFGFPIRTSTHVMGVVEFFSREILEPDRGLLDFFDSVGYQVGQFLERRSAEEALQLREEQMRLLLTSTAEAIYGTDLKGNCTFFNPSCGRMLGFSQAEDLVGRNMHELLHSRRDDGSPYPEQECPIFQTAAKGEPCHSDKEVFWRSDGTSFPVEYWAFPMRRDGEPVGVVVTFLDITERRAHERMKNEFVSIVSHELRTPLTSIRGSLGLLAGGLLNVQPEKQKRMLDIAISNTDRLVRLINDILDIERMESGKAVLRNELCDGGKLASQAAETMQAMATKAQVQIELESKSVFIRADPDRILQVLSNLLSNAIKFSNPAGRIWLTVAEHGKDAVFVVRDEGRGIPPSKLEAIFERFQQVDASDAREKGGTGLGLPICRAIAQQHGGRIWVESTLGKGSRFIMTLPLACQSEEQSAVEPSADVRTVLVCYEASKRENVKSLLEKRGYRVIFGKLGAAAIDLAIAQRPDAILLDLHTPDRDGWRTLAGLKERAETRNIPILIVEVSTEDPETNPSLRTRVLDETMLLQWLEGAPVGAGSALRVLVVEDDADLANVLVQVFENRGVHAHHASTGKMAIEMSARVRPDLVVLDLVLPEGDGFSVVEWLRRDDTLRTVPLIVYTAQELSTEDRARLKLGPTEFMTKGRVGVPEFEGRVFGLLDELCKRPHGHADLVTT